MSHKDPMFTKPIFAGKTILVTGGGTGLGKSMSHYLAKLGADIIITSRRQEVLDATAAEIQESTGSQVLPMAADVREIDQVRRVIGQGTNTFKQIYYSSGLADQI